MFLPLSPLSRRPPQNAAQAVPLARSAMAPVSGEPVAGWPEDLTQRKAGWLMMATGWYTIGVVPIGHPAELPIKVMTIFKDISDSTVGEFS